MDARRGMATTANAGVAMIAGATSNRAAFSFATPKGLFLRHYGVTEGPVWDRVTSNILRSDYPYIDNSRWLCMTALMLWSGCTAGNPCAALSSDKSGRITATWIKRTVTVLLLSRPRVDML
jgi:hypothetical protein